MRDRQKVNRTNTRNVPYRSNRTNTPFLGSNGTNRGIRAVDFIGSGWASLIWRRNLLLITGEPREAVPLAKRLVGRAAQASATPIQPTPLSVALPLIGVLLLEPAMGLMPPLGVMAPLIADGRSGAWGPRTGTNASNAPIRWNASNRSNRTNAPNTSDDTNGCNRGIRVRVAIGNSFQLHRAWLTRGSHPGATLVNIGAGRWIFATRWFGAATIHLAKRGSGTCRHE
ncbi:hypothetical protein IWX64_002688 [Arthrobacter sp. CAN_A212]